MVLNDAQARSDIQCTIELQSLSELSALVSLLGSGLSLNFTVNIESVKEIWSVAEPLIVNDDDDVEVYYQKWLAVSKRQDTAIEKRWFQGFIEFIPQFNQADNPLIILEPKAVDSVQSGSAVSIH